MTNAPAAYAPFRRSLGVAIQADVAVPVAPAYFIPFDKFDWVPKPTWLYDMGVRGVMANDAFAAVQGVKVAEWTYEGPAYADTAGFFLANLFGDVTTTGTATTPTGILAALSNIGAVSVSSSVSIPTGTLIQIDVGSLAEIVTTTGVPTGAGPYAIPVPALTKAHASGVAITAIQTAGSFAHRMTLMNSGQGRGQAPLTAQPSVFCLTQFYGPAASTGTRQFTYCCVSEVSFKWTAETDFLTMSVKGMSLMPTIAGAIPVPTYSTVLPLPSWETILGLGGPASGGTLVKTCESGEYTIKRTVKPYFTGQNSQGPYTFMRHGLSVDWKSDFIAADESTYLYMDNNVQPQLQMILSNGLTGANAAAFQFDMQQCLFAEDQPNFGKDVIEFSAGGKGILNTTNAGYTGGQSPISVTLTNAIPSGTYT